MEKEEEKEYEKELLELADGNTNDYAYLLAKRLCSKDLRVRAAAWDELNRLIEFEERP